MRIFFDTETVGPRDAGVLAMLRDNLLDERAPRSISEKVEEVLSRAGYLEYYQGLKTGKGEWLAENWSTTLLETRLAIAAEDSAVDTLLARVIVIGLAIDDGPVEIFDCFDRDETELLAEVRDKLDGLVTPVAPWWIGHNCRGFDIPLLITRWRRFGILPPRTFPQWTEFGRARGAIFDTMLACGSNKPYVQAQKAAVAHGLAGFKVTMWNHPERGTIQMDGSLVGEAFAMGEYQLIREYCAADVEATRELASRMTYGWTMIGGPQIADTPSHDGALLSIACQAPSPGERLKLLADYLGSAGVIQPHIASGLCAGI